MGLDKGYGILKCRVIEGRKELDDDTPHYQVNVSDGNVEYRIAINVRSVQQPYDLLYLVDDNFEHYITAELVKLDLGYTEIPESERKDGGIALDYIRSNLFKPGDMKPLPYSSPGENNDLNEIIDLYIQRAIESEEAVIYAFGETWGPESKPDKIFNFSPGRGIHNIHMNQGNSGKFARENGVYQDGALLIHFPSRQQWVAAFFAFQSQSFHTDDRTGQPLPDKVGSEPPKPGTPPVKAAVKIAAALVNPPGDDPGKESVSLINVSPAKVDFDGWAIVDRFGRQRSLNGLKIEPGEVVKVSLSGQDIQLSNNGGTITLLNKEGLKVDGVAYTKEDVKDQGWTIVF